MDQPEDLASLDRAFVAFLTAVATRDYDAAEAITAEASADYLLYITAGFALSLLGDTWPSPCAPADVLAALQDLGLSIAEEEGSA